MSKRQLSLSIDLGGEQIQVERVEAVESLGRPFVITIDLASTLGEIDLYPHLGKPASVSVYEDDEFMRYFHGLVVEGEYLSERASGSHHYRLTLRPWTHLLAQNRDFAIFQKTTTIDILHKVFADHGMDSHVEYGKLTGTPRTRDYCVQYGESDFAFVSRLIEEEGYYYYFDHGASGHKLVLCDSPQSHVNGAVASMTFNPTSAVVANSGSAIRSIAGATRFVERWTERVLSNATNSVAMREFDFKKPQQPVDANTTAEGAHPNDAHEIYEWPGRYLTTDDGKALSKAALEARRADRQTYSGETQLGSVACGRKFTLKKHPFDRLNQSYMLVRTHHVLSSEQYESGGSGGGGHQVYIEAVPASVAWRAPQISPRPVVRGPETAIVTGPDGEDIHTEKYGRVKVRFHWDRSGRKGDTTSCWIRVAQTGHLGNMILPRVGHEVIVDFLDGDPDRPIIVGRVYNDGDMPTYPLPANKTRAVWRTKTYTSAGGSDDVGAAKKLDTDNPSANELRFEDKIGKEEVFVHAQRDMTTRIRRSETHNIGLDQGIDMGGSRTVTIKETDSNDVGKSITINAGTTISMEAKQSITLTVGQSKLVIEPTSVTLETMTLKINAQATADLESTMTTVKGNGMLTLKGGITMIN